MPEIRDKRGMFNFEVPKDFQETFNKFKYYAGDGERSASALIRILIKKYVDDRQSSNQR